MTSHDYNTLTSLTESMDLLPPVRRIVTNFPPWISIQVAPFPRQNTWEVLNRLGWHGLLAYHFYPNWLPDSNGVEGGIFMNFPHQTMLMDGMMRCYVVWWEFWQTKIRRKLYWCFCILCNWGSICQFFSHCNTMCAALAVRRGNGLSPIIPRKCWRTSLVLAPNVSRTQLEKSPLSMKTVFQLIDHHISAQQIIATSLEVTPNRGLGIKVITLFWRTGDWCPICCCFWFVCGIAWCHCFLIVLLWKDRIVWPLSWRLLKKLSQPMAYSKCVERMKLFVDVYDMIFCTHDIMIHGSDRSFLCLTISFRVSGTTPISPKIN